MIGTQWIELQIVREEKTSIDMNRLDDKKTSVIKNQEHSDR